MLCVLADAGFVRTRLYATCFTFLGGFYDISSAQNIGTLLFIAFLVMKCPAYPWVQWLPQVHVDCSADGPVLPPKTRKQGPFWPKNRHVRDHHRPFSKTVTILWG